MRTKLIGFVFIVALFGSNKSLYSQNASLSEEIEHLKANRTYFSTWDEWPSLVDQVNRTGNDVHFSPQVYEHEIACLKCPLQDPSNDAAAKKAARLSDLVLVGRVVSKASILTRKDSFIVTDSQFVVEEIWKNSEHDKEQAELRVGNQITLVTPGGIVRSNGHIIEARLPNFEEIRTGDRYVFFLRYIPATKSYTPVGLDGFDVSNKVVVPIKHGFMPASALSDDSVSFVRALHSSTQKAMQVDAK